MPINVVANYYAPLRREIVHHDLVCQIQIRSYSSDILEFYSQFILRSAYYINIPISGPLRLPVQTSRWTVIKSPFAQAKSKENFERKTHKRVFKIWDSDPEVVDIWLSFLTKHSLDNIGLKVNMYKREPLDFDKEMENIDISGFINNSKLFNNLDTQEDIIGEKVHELLNTSSFSRHFKDNEYYSQMLESVNQDSDKIESSNGNSNENSSKQKPQS
ncbi:mitochondrial 37S ribosomal protein uS10m [Ascoidea rubescens DSM 1968]|uniref:Small ribosomal subunit protein uS10m n=1 Tax=Ascoidea rubescens DSM 1968 TaxID=1344418 RepID=A0A1D2VKA2_9ASCO|nr:ribosomal protein S10 [Ascoidea rubescens DSM 1968]ODV62041.1 ribosomal protein S10 [Ascoidea rubescens DSM 1968]